MEHFFCQLHGTRPHWPADMSADEAEVMGAHFDYLKGLVASGHCLMAGPCFQDPPVGLVVLAAPTLDEARTLIDSDPSVVAGIHTYSVAPFKLSLFAGPTH